MPPPLQVDLLTLKVVFVETRVTWATSVRFLGLSVLDLGPMHATNRCQTRHHLMPTTLGAEHKNKCVRSASG